MAKRKKKNSGILDTSAGEIMLDLSAPDEDRTIEGLLRLEKNFTLSDNMTVSFRIPSNVLEHAKDLARQIGVEEKRDVHWQKLILESFLRVHPIKNDESK